MTDETTTSVMNKVVKEDVGDTEEPRKEEKLTSIMEAANALTALGDDDEVTPDASLAAAKVNVNVEQSDDPPVDKPTEDDPPSTNKAASVVTETKGEPHESSSVAATKTTTTVQRPTAQPQPQPQTEDGTVTSANSGGTGTSTANGTNPKRYLPEHKKPDAAPTFPEKVRPRSWFIVF